MDPIVAMTGTTLGVLGGLATIVNIIVQLIKDYFPKVPTKLITIIVSMIVCIIYLIITTPVLSWMMIIYGIFGGFIISYVAMNGFDTVKEIKQRYTLKDIGGDD